MELPVLNEITLSGSTYVTIDHDDEGLNILTHKDTEVTFNDGTIVIKDPVQAFSGNVVNAWSGSGTLFQCNMFGGGTFTRGNNMVIRNGVVIGGDNITVMGCQSSTKEECVTPHHIKCNYDHIRRVTSKGAMKTTFLVPLDTVVCRVSSSGTGALLFTANQSFAKLDACLTGKGDIQFSPIKITDLSLSLEGTGDIVLHGDNIPVMKAIITLVGTGDINMGDASINTAVISLTGTGDIGGFTLNDEATISLTGMGDIECKASAYARIKESKTGFGKIKVTRLGKPNK